MSIDRNNNNNNNKQHIMLWYMFYMHACNKKHIVKPRLMNGFVEDNFVRNMKIYGVTTVTIFLKAEKIRYK